MTRRYRLRRHQVRVRLARLVPSLCVLEERREREARALQAAWVERARCHELLTALRVEPRSLPERLADLAGQLQEARALLAAVARAHPTPTPTAAASRTESP